MLKGVRVIESAVLMNGDFAGRLLADLGADVVKVEAPKIGDYLRDIGGTITPRNSLYHLVGNRNKRSLTLNLKSDEGRAIFWELQREADIFVDGFAGDACAKLGIGYEEQKKRNPGIVYMQTSGFGASGPYASIPTHGQMMTALSGDAPMKMDGDGFVRRDPNRAVIGPTLGVQDAAVYAALTAVAALVRRAKTGEGCYIDVAASDAAICNNVLMTNNALNLHRVTDRDGIPKTGDAGGGAKYQYYETKDRKIVLFCAMEHRFWDAFCRVTGREDLLAEKKDKFVFDWGDGSKLRREVQKIFHSKTQAEWIELAAKHHIAIGPAYAADDFHTDPHTKARGILFDDMHPHAGPYTYFGWPARIPGQQFSVKRPAPLLGEQTEEILAEFGRSEADIARLRGAGAV